jgi:hypothetical protein
MSNVQLYLHIDEDWCSILAIPASDFSRFTTRPLRWLQFLGYTIHGRKGSLKTHPNSPELDSYATDVADLNNKYYYVSPGKRNLNIVVQKLTFV